jgi:lysophospholipase L1-like esterase
MRPALILVALAACTRAPSVDLPAPPASPAPASPPAPTTPPASASGPPIRYLALGDSFTAGTGSRPDQAFPQRLAVRLRARGTAIAVENLGVNGYTTDDLSARELPRVAPFAPTLVTLAIGANDLVRGSTLERYRGQVRGILAAIVAAGVPAGRVFVLPQPDWSRSPVAADFGDPRAIRAKIEAYNDALRAEAEAVGARWVDLFPRMKREAEAGMIAPDGLHPAAGAYDEWAEDLAGRVVPP